MSRRTRPAACLLALLASAACGRAGGAAAPRTVQPGAPGEPSREVDAGALAERGPRPVSGADVRFMRDMIVHHAQALRMVALVPERTDSRELRLMAERIEVSQRDEIRRVQGWLRDRGQEAPGLDSLLRGGHAHHAMPGMLTPEQLAALGAARGPEFDRLFLERMIQHHRGALAMVDELLASPGAAQDPEVHQFASDVVADQTAEILRMQATLDAL